MGKLREAAEKYIAWHDEDNAEELLKAVEEAENNMHWIPVADRLPKEDGYYLVTMLTPGNGRPYTDFLYWDAGDWLTDEAGDSVLEQETKVVAWRPMPEPYQPEG
ncbi:DUF551 domain-containing protein [Hungatella hathewayi]|uniref:DUF551 domain-containing protein n=1 Tax=Hungatella hathewayi TaxID=154046 RepID=UPI00356358E0